jgi:hypothetical protein
MSKFISLTPLVMMLTMLSSKAHAIVAVPEIDGSNAAIAIGLTAGVVALVREYRRKK